ncbi:MAG: hypothetical protein LQ338_004636 [Usnochroma carphineum]|nr:MAG: hypothetical protein LQ338_004636 [Usnochroma carphineum]
MSPTCTEATSSAGWSQPENKSSTPAIGQEAPKDWKFCPLGAVSKWPYKFFQRIDSETISQNFFAAGRFRTRGWTLYYIHTLLDTAHKPLILVPAHEVQALFDDIKLDLRLLVYFPKADKEPGFLLSFTENGIPLPRYLGRLDLEHSLDEMEAKIPPYKPDLSGSHRLDDRSFAAFKKKMEDAIQATKQKSKSQKDKKKRDRIGLKQSWCEQLKRAQCYLGIRPRVVPGMKDPVSDPTIPPRELENALQRYNLSQCTELPGLDTSDVAPYPFHSNVIFICVDVEAYEKMDRPITEIGISTLDTNDLAGLAPGELGRSWMKKIRSRHFRIKETAHLNNSEFVTGCADRFEPEFGQSEWISIEVAPSIVASCFRPPYSRQSEAADPEPSSICNLTADSGQDDHGPKRQLVLVGHDISMDIAYLRKIGYDVANLSNLVETLDTSDLYRAWKHQQNPSKLGSILVDLELTGWNLHNAGNDAAYTLQALIGIAISARKSEAARLLDSEAQRKNHTETVEREARERAQEQADEWAAADIEGGDGGAPTPLVRIGWPVPSVADAPTTNAKDRTRENRSSVQVLARQDAKQSEAVHTASPPNRDEPEAQEKAFVGTFSQSMCERLAMLEKVDGETGGVRLPGSFGTA